MTRLTMKQTFIIFLWLVLRKETTVWSLPVSNDPVTIELDPVKANPERFRYDSFSETNETVPEQSRIKMPPDPKDVLSKCPEFECSNGNCVQHYYICDGTDDCLDNSDEVNCDKHGCDYDEYRCPSGKCISAEWICDQVLDCRNGEDELNCSY